MQQIPFTGRMIFIGWGAMAHGVMPLMLRHFTLTGDRVTIISPHIDPHDVVLPQGAQCIEARLTRETYRDMLAPHIAAGDHIVNLSVDVDSLSLVSLAQEIGATYIDASNEPWEGGYIDANLSLAERTNYSLRERFLTQKRDVVTLGSTAILCHGANPGIISHMLKQALLTMALDSGIEEIPQSQEAWARLMETLGIRAVQIAERDTQYPRARRRDGEFINTWSVDGFLSESAQPAELGWGTHERKLPHDAQQHMFGCRSALYLRTPGCMVRVRSWTPILGAQVGRLITHDEAISIADYFSRREGDTVAYRPTVYYAYHPIDDALLGLEEFIGNDFKAPTQKRVLHAEDIASGADALGVLLMGNERGAYWYGSILSHEAACDAVPHNTATSLQVTAGLLSATCYALTHPYEGILSPDDLPFDDILEPILRYIGPLHGEYTDWTPLHDRQYLFNEANDAQDPWQFVNFRIL